MTAAHIREAAQDGVASPRDLMIMPPQSKASLDAAWRMKFRRGGYADRPGTGPEGETCKSCKHYVRKEMSRAYLKCALRRAYWTGGPGTDIKARAPACSKWETPDTRGEANK